MATDDRPYIIKTYDRWIILVIVLVAGWFLFRPIFAYAVYYRGLSFERMIQMHTAEHYYKKSIRIYPNIADGWIGLGELYYMWAPAQHEYYQKGIDVFTQGLSANPHNSTLSFDLGRMYFRARDYRNAVGALLRSAHDNPQSVFAWDYAAWASLRLGQRSNATRYWHQVLRVEPRNEAARRALRRYGV